MNRCIWQTDYAQQVALVDAKYKATDGHRCKASLSSTVRFHSNIDRIYERVRMP